MPPVLLAGFRHLLFSVTDWPLLGAQPAKPGSRVPEADFPSVPAHNSLDELERRMLEGFGP
jgi:hypothetical protein